MKRTFQEVSQQVIENDEASSQEGEPAPSDAVAPAPAPAVVDQQVPANQGASDDPAAVANEDSNESYSVTTSIEDDTTDYDDLEENEYESLPSYKSDLGHVRQLQHDIIGSGGDNQNQPLKLLTAATATASNSAEPPPGKRRRVEQQQTGSENRNPNQIQQQPPQQNRNISSSAPQPSTSGGVGTYHPALVGIASVSSGCGALRLSTGSVSTLATSDSFASYFPNTASFAIKSKLKKKEEPSGPNLFKRLSDEIIVHILKYLNRPSLVAFAKTCKRMRRIGYDESLWRRVDLSSKSLGKGALGVILGQRKVQTLRMSKTAIATPPIGDKFSYAFPEPHISRLKHLDLTMANINCASLEVVLKTTRYLEKLCIEGLAINEQCLLAISQNRDLDTLNMGCCTGPVSYEGMKAIVDRCPKLTDVNFGWLEIDQGTMDMLCQKRFRKLERLNIAGYRELITDGHISLLTTNCTQLKELDVSEAGKITPLSISTIIERLGNTLEGLSTSRCYSIKPCAYLELETLKPIGKFKFLNVFGVIHEPGIVELKEKLSAFDINKCFVSSIARPTVGVKRTSIWGLRVRDNPA